MCYLTQLGNICTFTKYVLNAILQIVNKDTERYWTDLWEIPLAAFPQLYSEPEMVPIWLQLHCPFSLCCSAGGSKDLWSLLVIFFLDILASQPMFCPLGVGWTNGNCPQVSVLTLNNSSFSYLLRVTLITQSLPLLHWSSLWNVPVSWEFDHRCIFVVFFSPGSVVFYAIWTLEPWKIILQMLQMRAWCLLTCAWMPPPPPIPQMCLGLLNGGKAPPCVHLPWLVAFWLFDHTFQLVYCFLEMLKSTVLEGWKSVQMPSPPLPKLKQRDIATGRGSLKDSSWSPRSVMLKGATVQGSTY